MTSDLQLVSNYQYRIYYEDTDAGGVVYHSNYLKFFERARTDFLRSIGIVQSELAEKEKIAFAIHHCEIDYVSPARLDDLIDVSVELKNISAASLVFYQEIRKSGHILSRLTATIVCISTDNFKPKKLPENIRKNLLNAR